MLCVDKGISQAAAGGRAIEAVEVTVLVAVRCGKEGNVDRHFAGDQRTRTATVRAHDDRAIQFPLRHLFGDQTINAALEAGDCSLANVRNQFSMHDVHRTGGNLDVADSQRIDFLDQLVKQIITVAQAVVRRDGHAILQARGDNRIAQPADEFAAVVGDAPDGARRTLGMRLQRPRVAVGNQLLAGECFRDQPAYTIPYH